MRLYELNNLQPFKTDEYNTPNQMEIMANPDYWREKKGVVGGVQWMTPTQYIQACEIGFRNNGSEGLVRGGRNPELIKKYGFDMKRGDKFPMLELDYRNDYFGQEGLHRAMAAEEIGVKKLPVFIMKDSPEKMEEAIKLASRKTDPKVAKFMETYFKVTQVHPFDNQARIAWDGKSTATVREYGDRVRIEAIQTLAPGERSGSANGLIMTLVKIADETGVAIELSASPFGTSEGKLTKRQLMAWYKRRGFVVVGGDVMEYVPKIHESVKLTEGISPVVYHFMGIRNAASVLQQNKFRLTASPGTGAEKALQKGDRMYYLSTTRHKLGGYHIDNSWSGVIFELDGVKLAQNYAGKAVDYWGPSFYGQPGGKGPEKKEAEDRVYSYEPYIKNANKYIKSIHILYDEKGQKNHDQLAIDIRRMFIAAKRNGIKPFLYVDKQDWLLQDPSKAVNPADISLIAHASGKEKDQKKSYGLSSSARRQLSPWVELYKAPVGSKISKEAEKTRYNYVLYGYSDAAQSLSADMHNAKSKPADETGLDTLLKIFRKENIKSPQEYLDLLHKKWAPKEESINEYKDVSQDSDVGESSMTGYVVATEEEQLTNYFIMEHGVPERVIEDIRLKYDVVAVGRNMWVDEDYRGQGHGADLLEDFMVEAADSGAQAVLIIADAEESNAFNLVDWYKSFGFEVMAQTGAGPFMVFDFNES